MALLTLQQTDTDLQGASECGVIAACATGTISSATIESLLVDSGTPGVTEQTVDIPASTSRLAVFLQSADGVPGKATWEAGDWIIRFNVTTAQMDTVLDAIWVCRVNNACGTVATIASETAIGLDVSGGGIITRTLAGIEHTGTDTDEIYIVVQLANAFTMASRTVGITPDQIIDTPIVLAGGVVEEGAGSSTGAAAVTGGGQSTAKADGSSAGTSTVSGDAEAIFVSDGSSAGIATVSGDAKSVFVADGSAAGLSTVSGVGEDASGPAIEQGAGSSAGTATASGTSQSLFLAAGASSGTTNVSATAVWFVLVDGSASGVAVVSGTGEDASSPSQGDEKRSHRAAHIVAVHNVIVRRRRRLHRR